MISRLGRRKSCNDSVGLDKGWELMIEELVSVLKLTTKMTAFGSINRIAVYLIVKAVYGSTTCTMITSSEDEGSEDFISMQLKNDTTKF
ncbi:hypothetical protein HAX54_025196 [Datura stramonium]|uniref:Uncharacterized protein n=1 Tax=Datura stramonium TaxID=4076 RepID=A0ABS8S5Z6_DATST|nr:hypothetical protein [Datura stramonium]